MPDNNRKYKRIKRSCKVRIRSQKNKQEDKIAKTKDLSGSGILFNFENRLEIGDIVEANFYDPVSVRVFQADAKVVRVELNPDNSYDIGIEFIDLKDDEKQLIENSLTEND
jgi:c-di-GMP-binding flagellar brake protein YcgR